MTPRKLRWIGVFFMRVPDKPFLSWSQQMQRIRDEYNLEVEDPLDFSSIQFLAYYDLINGYKHILMDNNGKFCAGTNLLYLTNLCRLERKFRGVLISYSDIVETAFKNILAYVISQHFGVFKDEYLSLCNYTRSTSFKKRQRFLETINGLKYAIANIDAFQSTLRYIRKYRNLAAHNLNFTHFHDIHLNPAIGYKLKGTLLTDAQVGTARTGVLMYIVALFSMLEYPNSPIQFLGDIYPALSKLGHVYLNAIGITDENMKMFIAELRRTEVCTTGGKAEIKPQARK